MRILFTAMLLFIILFSSCKHKNDISEYREVCFDTEILPIFQNNCAVCHGNERTEKELKFIDYSTIIKSMEAGNPDGSKAYKSISKIAGEEAMPPGKPLSKHQRTLIRLWIEQGAKETNCSN